jgi:hypothetical protein
MSSDGEWAHCSREEFAGAAPFNDKTKAHVHKLEGDCKCGTSHGDPGNNVLHIKPHTKKQTGNQTIAATYNYLDEAGELLYQVVRYENPKTFKQRRKNSEGGWVWSVAGISRVLYRLPEIAEADTSQTVYICEGEKDAERLGAEGLLATTNAQGAGKWQDEFSDTLKGRPVVILPDNDEAGRKHARTVAASLSGKARSVKVINLPGLQEGGDSSDYLDAGGTGEELEQLAKDVPEWKPGENPHPNPYPPNSTNPTNSPNFTNSTNRPRTITAAELMNLEFEPTQWVVPNVLPEGLSLLAGKPKKGKSWMALGMCEAVAAGGVAFGTRSVDQGDTLYLALEDNTKRLQKRLKKVLNGRPAPDKMHLHTVWPRLDEGGAEQLDEWLTEHPEARLVVIDTLAKIRKPASGANVYAEDYSALELLLPLAAKHGVAIVVVHHLRKMAASDPMDEISSSTGLTAGVDGFLILRRTPGSKGPTLFVDGRDIEEPTEYALHWNINTATWTIEGDAEEVHISKERADILLTLNRSSEPMTPKEVSDAMPGAKHNNVKYLMWTMLGDGQLVKDGKGCYSPTNPTNPTNSRKADTYGEKDHRVSGVSGVSGVCGHGTPDGYSCDECETDDLFGGDVLHNAPPLHTPNGSSRKETPASFLAVPGEKITVAELQARRDQEQNADVGEV